ncbi:MAG: M15 family metallopeptidase [Firmicutes bacterium]|nr:M15 family metallopeptidase [Bacillota bacterium]
MDRAASMQDYSHAPGEDAAAIDTVDDNILLLVNKTHPLSRSYKAEDMVTLSKITSGVGTEETHKMRKVAADALEELFKGAEADGYDIRLRTGYRSYSYQNTLYSNYVKNNGQAAADRFSARPGKSEHQTGLCCDVGVNGVSLTGFNKRPEAKWIADHCHEYGFILRYPEGKEDVTGYMYESWHIRYVGIKAATEIHDQGLVLEEYMGVTD